MRKEAQAARFARALALMLRRSSMHRGGSFHHRGKEPFFLPMRAESVETEGFPRHRALQKSCHQDLWKTC